MLRIEWVFNIQECCKYTTLYPNILLNFLGSKKRLTSLLNISEIKQKSRILFKKMWIQI